MLQFRLCFKEVSANRFRRLPGTKQSPISRHSAVFSHPESISIPGPSLRPCTGQLSCIGHRCGLRVSQNTAVGAPRCKPIYVAAEVLLPQYWSAVVTALSPLGSVLQLCSRQAAMESSVQWMFDGRRSERQGVAAVFEEELSVS